MINKFISYAVIFILYTGTLWFLWNQVVSDVFNLSPINIWQAIGLFVLCNICFKSSNIKLTYSPKANIHLNKTV